MQTSEKNYYFEEDGSLQLFFGTFEELVDQRPDFILTSSKGLEELEKLFSEQNMRFSDPIVVQSPDICFSQSDEEKEFLLGGTFIRKTPKMKRTGLLLEVLTPVYIIFSGEDFTLFALLKTAGGSEEDRLGENPQEEIIINMAHINAIPKESDYLDDLALKYLKDKFPEKKIPKHLGLSPKDLNKLNEHVNVDCLLKRRAYAGSLLARSRNDYPGDSVGAVTLGIIVAKEREHLCKGKEDRDIFSCLETIFGSSIPNLQRSFPCEVSQNSIKGMLYGAILFLYGAFSSEIILQKMFGSAIDALIEMLFL